MYHNYQALDVKPYPWNSFSDSDHMLSQMTRSYRILTKFSGRIKFRNSIYIDLLVLIKKTTDNTSNFLT